MEQITMGEAAPEYQVFINKFKPKLTTDDCYTPPLVYEAVADWTAQTYGLDKASFVRPFWPGGDYQREEYPPGCVVVDTPPFSIMAEIVPWYCQRGIRFLLFNQHTTGMKCYVVANRCTVLATSCAVTYANGVPYGEGERIDALDSQRNAKKSIFGGGLLVSERLAAERAAATVWELSDREKEIVRQLSGK